MASSRLIQAIRRSPEVVDNPPVALWDVATAVTTYAGMRPGDYYRDPGNKLRAQLCLIDDFPEVVWVPGIYADYGVVLEASAFGCPIRWLDEAPPHAEAIIADLADLDRLRVPNPEEDGLMAEALAQYRYFWMHTPRKYVEQGYLGGVAETLGPVELSAMLRGYDRFPLDLLDDPAAAHRLLEIVTEGVLKWIRAQEKVNGKIDFLIMPDHYGAQISPELFQEFALPYLKHIYAQFPAAIKLHHNEGNSKHYLHLIPETGANVFHCGRVDLDLAKKTIGDRVCLMGNLEACNVMLYGKPEEVKAAALDCLRMAAPGGGYILSIGGSMAPGTPRGNLQAVVEADNEYCAGAGG